MVSLRGLTRGVRRAARGASRTARRVGRQAERQARGVARSARGVAKVAARSEKAFATAVKKASRDPVIRTALKAGAKVAKQANIIRAAQVLAQNGASLRES